jgi:hypothetical protein
MVNGGGDHAETLKSRRETLGEGASPRRQRERRRGLLGGWNGDYDEHERSAHRMHSAIAGLPGPARQDAWVFR